MNATIECPHCNERFPITLGLPESNGRNVSVKSTQWRVDCKHCNTGLAITEFADRTVLAEELD